jgi:hypothetical protein
MVANSVSGDDSICFDNLPALRPSKNKKTDNWKTCRKYSQKNETAVLHSEMLIKCY